MKLPFSETYLESNGISFSVPKMELLEWLHRHTDIDRVMVTVKYQMWDLKKLSNYTFNSVAQTKTFPITELDVTFMTILEMTIDIPDEIALLFKMTW